MEQLIYSRAALHLQHLVGDVGRVMGRNLEAGLTGLQEGFQVFDLRELEEAVQRSPDIKKDIEGLDLLSTGRYKIGRVAFEYMGHIDAQPVDIAGPEGMHIIFRYQGPFSLLDPGQLDLLMAVQMRVKVRELIFLHDDSLVMWHWNSELQYFHRVEFWWLTGRLSFCDLYMNVGISRILPMHYQNRVKTG